METAFDYFWTFVKGSLTLNPEVFRLIETLPDGGQVAFIIVLVAGLSQAIGQCIVLFVNRVKPIRFIFSLGISALLFALSYGFWVLSIWIVSHFVLVERTSIATAARTLGLSYTPQMFSFLVALPYIGIPLSIVFSIWSLLAEITGLKVLIGLNSWGAFACTGLGWVVLQVLQRTIGRPISAFGRNLMNWVAGTKLVTDRDELAEIIQEGNPSIFNDISGEFLTESPVVQSKKKSPSLVKFFVLAFLAFAVVLLLSPNTYSWLSVGYRALGKTVQLAIDLTFISLIALLISILLTPLEALSWWAGWYGDRPLKTPGTLVREVPQNTSVSRYVLYLDGINQGSDVYLPEVDRFLNTLADALPADVVIVKGIMPYSVLNRPLTEDRPLAFLWQIVESLALKNPANPVGFIINLRNVFAVAIAADPRYGPIQNQGLAQVLFNSLLNFGYSISSQIPVSLIGYSGGGQMSMGAVPYLKNALKTSVEVISIAGVISGNTGAMDAAQVFHLVGKEDSVEKVGPIMFPGRWPVALLSNWNRAKRRGKITLISLGPVGHNGNTGPMGDQLLPDGRSHLQQTVDIVTGLLLKDWEATGLNPDHFRRVSNYELYKPALFNQPGYYPLKQSIDLEYYHPIGSWMGRLILPHLEDRETVKGVLFEIHHADAANQHRIGQIVNLRWSSDPQVQAYVELVKQDLNFIDQVQVSQQQGNIHPTRINHWKQIDPLESIAGSRPEDDVIVILPEPITVEDTGAGRPSLYIKREPIEITGRFYGFVRFTQFLGGDLFQVRHYNSNTKSFDGKEEIVYVPSVIVDRNGVSPSSNRDLEKSPINETGWYIYGAKNTEGKFVVQALAPHRLLALKPDQVIYGKEATLKYVNHQYWNDAIAQKGQVKTVLLNPKESPSNDEKSLIDLNTKSVAEWKAGDRALLLHLYGGIGGQIKESGPLGIYFGHFAFGVAKVVPDAFTNELRFDIEYRQIYTHNPDGIIAGTNSWIRYMGDRQWGWLGIRPVADFIIKFSPLTEDYDFNGIKFSPLSSLIQELDVMASRYRLGDGTGTTFVTPINSCSQDSSQALYTALRRIIAQFEINPLIMKWLRQHPDHEQTQRFIQLGQLVKALEALLTPLGKPRKDWQYNAPTLGRFAVESPVQTLVRTLVSWRTLLPRLVSDYTTMVFLQLGASVWILRTTQVGGVNPQIEPVVPTDFAIGVPKAKIK